MDPFASARTRPRPVLPRPIAERLAEDGARSAGSFSATPPVVLEQNAPVAGGAGRGGVLHGAGAPGSSRELVEGRLGTLIEDDFDWYVGGRRRRSGAVGAFVYVPDGSRRSVPIRIFHWLEGGRTLAAPRSVVVLGADASATVIEEHLSETADGISLHTGGTEVFVGESAKLVFAHAARLGTERLPLLEPARPPRAATPSCSGSRPCSAAAMVKTNSYFDLAGPGAQAFVHGFMFGDTRQHFHLHTLQRHLVDHTTSDLLIKGCLRIARAASTRA